MNNCIVSKFKLNSLINLYILVLKNIFSQTPNKHIWSFEIFLKCNASVEWSYILLHNSSKVVKHLKENNLICDSGLNLLFVFHNHFSTSTTISRHLFSTMSIKHYITPKDCLIEIISKCMTWTILSSYGN